MARVNHKRVKQLLNEKRSRIGNSSHPAFLQGILRTWPWRRRGGINTTAASM